MVLKLVEAVREDKDDIGELEHNIIAYVSRTSRKYQDKALTLPSDILQAYGRIPGIANGMQKVHSHRGLPCCGPQPHVRRIAQRMHELQEQEFFIPQKVANS